jgi:hypothetical protein
VKYLDLSVTVPIGLLMVICGVALLCGVDPWHLARGLAISVVTAAPVVTVSGVLMLIEQGRRGL